MKRRDATCAQQARWHRDPDRLLEGGFRERSSQDQAQLQNCDSPARAGSALAPRAGRIVVAGDAGAGADQRQVAAGARGLPFRSPHLRRSDGIASRIDWHPTQVHLRFLQLLRAEARRVAGGGRSGAQAA
jgi:hypothetical protein